MTKAELVEAVSRVSDLTRKHSEVIVDAVFSSIIDALQKGDKIELRGFGSFRVRRRDSRTGRNPKTGAGVVVPAKKVPHFKPGKELRELINRQASSGGAHRSVRRSTSRTRRPRASWPAASPRRKRSSARRCRPLPPPERRRRAPGLLRPLPPAVPHACSMRYLQGLLREIGAEIAGGARRAPRPPRATRPSTRPRWTACCARCASTDRRLGLTNLFWLAHTRDVAECLRELEAKIPAVRKLKYSLHPLLSSLLPAAGPAARRRASSRRSRAAWRS